MSKAIHEAKVHSSWIDPNAGYDEALRQFVLAILDEKKSGRFLDDFRAFQKRISHVGLFNSLSQTLLKITAPGVPDFYQGMELWDFSLVDPDNRRPVDYERRKDLLRGLNARVADAGERLPALARELTACKEDGRIKLHVTHQGLKCRRQHPGLFTEGDYVPVAALGAQSANVFAFVRRKEARWALAAVPRLIAGMISEQADLPLGFEIWQDGLLVLPGVAANQRCENVFTGECLDTFEYNGQTVLALAKVFAHFPVALLVNG
jgi:(1->4)-alpha-D-glucan 1-alpha-D-glucosylmutase